MEPVPILNQPATVLTWYPTCLMKCNCRDNEFTLIILTGFANNVICPKCQKMYSIAGVRPDGKTIDVNIGVPVAGAGSVQ